MVQTYGPLNQSDDVVPYLMAVGNALGDGKITHDEAKRQLESVLTHPVLVNRTEDERNGIKESYTRQFQIRENTRAQAQRIGEQQAQAQQPAGGANAPPAGPALPVGPAPPAGPAPPNPADLEPRGAAGPTGDELREFQEWWEAHINHQPEPAPAPSNSKKRPWHDLPTVENDATLHPVVRQTRLLVREYTEDLDATKRDLLGTSNLPTLADSIWRSILKDEYVDLDKIFTAYNSPIDTRKRSEKLAEGLWLQTESDTPSKRMASSADWLVTFRTYMRAVLVVFPHRKVEFETWEDLVSTKFRIYKTSMHRHILALEASSRRSIFDSTSRCLLDTHVLEQLEPSWVCTEGTEYAGVSSSASGSDRPRKKPRTSGGNPGSNTNRPPCNNWNGKGCTYNGCRYRHVCSSCGGEHPKSGCTKTTAK